jgi:hypothetical protein
MHSNPAVCWKLSAMLQQHTPGGTDAKKHSDAKQSVYLSTGDFGASTSYGAFPMGLRSPTNLRNLDRTNRRATQGTPAHHQEDHPEDHQEDHQDHQEGPYGLSPGGPHQRSKPPYRGGAAEVQGHPAGNGGGGNAGGGGGGGGASAKWHQQHYASRHLRKRRCLEAPTTVFKKDNGTPFGDPPLARTRTRSTRRTDPNFVPSVTTSLTYLH